ncbi:sulfatase [Nibrella saemangeumensis]|uniref:Sulfatase n=1 Tax=Nibrella saemangeumensis TaxID=1084526 RepID=A0ABP8MLF5_9BACT
MLFLFHRTITYLLLGTCLLAGWLLLTSHAGKAPPQRPDILFFFADDWGFPHAGIYGDRVAKTPHFDRLAQQGLLFTQAFCASPSCTPSRAAVLTGRYPHQLEAGANLWSYLPKKFSVYPDRLQATGYRTGYCEKGWGPGGGWLPGWKSHPDGYASNPAGERYKSFTDFLQQLPADQPFCFWYGTGEPHRPFTPGEGIQAGYRPEAVDLPPYLPDTPATRSDLLDYYHRIELMDKKLGEALDALAKSGRLDNTLIVVTSDNGHPFDRAKTNLYDAGTRVPMLVYWKGKVNAGRTDALVNLGQLAPTFLEAAGLQPQDLSFTSLMPLFKGNTPAPKAVYLEREVHYIPMGDSLPPDGRLSYPMRAVRTNDFLYIRNCRPDRYFAGEVFYRTGMQERQPASAQEKQLFTLAYGQRPAEELYDVRKDPHQLNNLAGNKAYARQLTQLRQQLNTWMKQTGDPRLVPTDNRFDEYPTYRLK